MCECDISLKFVLRVSYLYCILYLMGLRYVRDLFMAAHSNGRVIIFRSSGYFLLLLSFFLSFLFFLAYSQRSEIGCLPYFHT